MSKLTLDHVHKYYSSDIRVLNDINIDVESGEFLVLLGPSGCGKSTLLHAIAGLHSINEGEIRLGGRVLNDVPCQNRDIAMVFQSYALYPSMTVRENIMFPLQMRKTPKEQREKSVDDVARLLQITHLLDRKPGQLSGGQRQRVAIGRALVREPSLFLFDEPLSNLDALLRVEMRTELKKLHQRMGRTTVYVTHDQIEAMTLATRIAILDKGIVQQLGTPNDVYNRPANIFVATFIGSPRINLLAGTVKNGQLTIDGTSTNLSIPSEFESALTNDYGGVTIGVRPEHFSVAGDAQIEEGEIEVEVEVTIIEPTGSDDVIVFRFAGEELSALVRSGSVKSLGLQSFRLDTRKLNLFDRTTGERIS